MIFKIWLWEFRPDFTVRKHWTINSRYPLFLLRHLYAIIYFSLKKFYPLCWSLMSQWWKEIGSTHSRTLNLHTYGYPFNKLSCDNFCVSFKSVLDFFDRLLLTEDFKYVLSCSFYFDRNSKTCCFTRYRITCKFLWPMLKLLTSK